MTIVMRAVGGVLILTIGVWAVLYLARKPVKQSEAERIATEQVHRSGQQLGFDPSRFRGPEMVQVDGEAYAFEWRYSDGQGVVEILVWVDAHGGTEISWKGDLEPLRKKEMRKENEKGSEIGVTH